MKREVKFLSGYNCIDFPCKFYKKCKPSNSHGKHGIEIVFYVHGEQGVVQFKLSTNWVPYKSIASNIGYRAVHIDKSIADLYPMPTDLGFHSRKPMYEGHTSMNKCNLLDGNKCYYDGSSLNANDAFYVLVNCGEEELWRFLEQYYRSVFEEGKYPEVKEYRKETV